MLIKSIEEFNHFLRLGNNCLRWDLFTLNSFIVFVPFSIIEKYMYYCIEGDPYNTSLYNTPDENIYKYIKIYSWNKKRLKNETEVLDFNFKNPSEAIDFCEQHFRNLIVKCLLNGKHYELSIDYE